MPAPFLFYDFCFTRMPLGALCSCRALFYSSSPKHIHPLTHWWQIPACMVCVLNHIHTLMMQHQMQFKVQYLVQGHFDVVTLSNKY